MFSAFLLMIAEKGQAQKINFRAELDSSTIRIGEQTVIHLKVWSSQDADLKKLTWPKQADTIIKGIQVVKVSGIDTLKPDKAHESKTGREQRITITSFDSGYYAVPPFTLILNGDSSKPLLTDAMLLHVQGMVVDTTLAIKDIKEPLKDPFDWHELIPLFEWIGLGLVVLVILILVIRQLMKKKPVEKKILKPQIPPHVLALENLRKLNEQKLWQHGNLKVYHSNLTDIIRLYIEQRFRINALEQTSDEILSSFKSVTVSIESRERLQQVFRLADLVKFAKQHALPDENEMSMKNAIAFVEETKQDPNETKRSPEEA